MNTIQTMSPATSKSAITTASNTLCELPWSGKINIRGDINDKSFTKAIEGVLDTALPTKAHTCVCQNDLIVYWLGPNEWLVECEIGKTAQIIEQARAALGDTHYAIVDVSDYYTVLQLEGENAAQLLAKACPLDLHQRVFNEGMCTQTRFGHASILLHQTSENSYKIQVRWSFAEYVWDYLVSTMKTL